MEERVFLSKECKPTEQSIQSALGTAHLEYKKLSDITLSYSKDWTFTKSSGWMLKVHDNKKALFYFIPLKNEFKISMAIRENEKEIFLKDDALESIRNTLLAAKKYSEGFALQFNIQKISDYEIVEVLIKKLIDIRTYKYR